jgi:hypothetical protein
MMVEIFPLSMSSETDITIWLDEATDAELGRAMASGWAGKVALAPLLRWMEETGNLEFIAIKEAQSTLAGICQCDIPDIHILVDASSANTHLACARPSMMAANDQF